MESIQNSLNLETYCTSCKAKVSVIDIYCLSCGKKLKGGDQSITVTTQILVYLVALFLSPLGLWPDMKYLRSHDKKSKKIGMIVIFLTLFSIIFSIWIATKLLSIYTSTLNQQLQVYRLLQAFI